MDKIDQKALQAMGSIEAMLTDIGVGFDRSSEDVLRLVLRGEDIVMPVNLWVEPEYSLVVIGSVLPFKVEDAKADETAMILNDLNARLVNGCFYLDREDRFIKFKITDSYLGAPVTKEAIRFHLELLIKSVDKYNDKLYAFNEGSVDRIFFTTCL